MSCRIAVSAHGFVLALAAVLVVALVQPERAQTSAEAEAEALVAQVVPVPCSSVHSTSRREHPSMSRSARAGLEAQVVWQEELQPVQD